MARTLQKMAVVPYLTTPPTLPTRVDRHQYETIVRRCLPVQAGTITDAWNRNYEPFRRFGDFNGTNFTKNGSCAISYDSTNPSTRVDRHQYETIVRWCLPVQAWTITDAWNRNYEPFGRFGDFTGTNFTKNGYGGGQENCHMFNIICYIQHILPGMLPYVSSYSICICEIIKIFIILF